jgi:hypothetical protein
MVHCVDHEVGYVGLLALIHHVVMFIHVKHMGDRLTIFSANPAPIGKCTIMPINNNRNGTVCPIEHALQTQ